MYLEQCEWKVEERRRISKSRKDRFLTVADDDDSQADSDVERRKRKRRESGTLALPASVLRSVQRRSEGGNGDGGAGA